MTGLRDRMRRVREKVGNHHKHDKEPVEEGVDLSHASVHSADSVAFTEVRFCRKADCTKTFLGATTCSGRLSCTLQHI